MEVKIMDEITKEDIVRLGNAVGDIKDNGFNVMAPGGAIWHRRHGVIAKRLCLSGETYPIKEEIKAIGGMFEPHWGGQPVWMVPIRADNIDALIALVSRSRVKGQFIEF